MKARAGTDSILVVGAGPAGCAAAYVLGRAGLETQIVERGHPGKDKACGDAFIAPAVKYLGQFGITEHELRSLGGVRFIEVEIASSRTFIEVRRFNHIPGWIVPRARIDQHVRDIVERLVAIRYGVFARAITPIREGLISVDLVEPGGRCRTNEFGAVVIATGADARLVRAIGLDGRPLFGASVTTYSESVQTRVPTFECSDGSYSGYRWTFPLGPYSNLGVCALTTASRRVLKGELEALLAAQEAGGAYSRVRGGIGRLWSGHGMRWHDRAGIVSCGDAAALVDPLTGEGLTAALESGFRAGHAVRRFLTSGDSRYLACYSAWVQQHFSTRYRRTPLRDFFATRCGLA